MSRAAAARSVLGAGRRTLSRMLARVPDRLTLEHGALERLPGILGVPVVGLARLSRLVDHPHQALSFAVTAARLRPLDPSTHIAVAEAALVGGREDFVNQPVVGVAATAVSDPVRARAAALEALRLDPDDPVAQRLAVVAELDAGDYVLADRRLDAAALAPFERCLLRATIADESGRSRGAHTRREAQTMTSAWQAAHDLRPGDHVVRDRLVRHLVQVGDYAAARHAAWPGGPLPISMSSTDIDALVGERPPTEWLYVAHAELTSVGRVVDAHQVKRQRAERDAVTHISWHSSVTVLVGRSQATSYRSGPEAAHNALTAGRIRFGSDPEQRIIQKLAADLRLSMGDPDAARAQRSKATMVDPLAENMHRELLQGAHVLVVGPAVGSRPTAEQLTRADVVAVTKRPLDRNLTSCPQLVYPTDASARLDLQPGELADHDVVVLRPSMRRTATHPIPDFASSRIMPAEDANTYLGTRFGVQRILYDLLHYAPATIELCGVDFFLSTTSYVDGYTDEIDRLYRPNDLQPSMSVAPHDYVWDFLFTQALHEHGLIEVGTDIESILRLGPIEYLRRLERVLTPTTNRESTL